MRSNIHLDLRGVTKSTTNVVNTATHVVAITTYMLTLVPLKWGAAAPTPCKEILYFSFWSLQAGRRYGNIKVIQFNMCKLLIVLAYLLTGKVGKHGRRDPEADDESEDEVDLPPKVGVKRKR
jgi:hypothetical protein